MGLKRLKRTWDALGRKDPLWAVLSLPEKRGRRWEVDEFFAWGRDEIDGVLRYARALGIELGYGRALDFGCGVGRLTQALADHFQRVDGVDIAPSMLGLADKYNRHGDRCRYRLNQSDDLRIFGEDVFDFIYSNITLGHMESGYSKVYLVEFLRVLKPQGLIVFQLPAERVPVAGAIRRAKRALTSLAPRPLLNLYHSLRTGSPRMEGYGTPREEVISWMEQHGGRVIDVEPDRWTPNWIGFRYAVTKDRNSSGSASSAYG
jgi:ubiquinone/menaquinone biosynthesis C-methylase UbiE